MTTIASLDPVKKGNMAGVVKMLFTHIMCMFWHFRRRCCFEMLDDRICSGKC